MIQLSSSATLMLRLFFPTIWVVFFGSFMVAGWLTSDDLVGPFDSMAYRLVTTIGLLGGILGIRFTLWRLHRADADEEHLYLSDYFRTYKYSRDSVERITLHAYGLFSLCRIQLQTKGSFGRVIWFLPSMKRMETLLVRYPGWGEVVKESEDQKD